MIKKTCLGDNKRFLTKQTCSLSFITLTGVLKLGLGVTPINVNKASFTVIANYLSSIFSGCICLYKHKNAGIEVSFPRKKTYLIIKVVVHKNNFSIS